MSSCRRFAPQNWLLWQRPLTEIYLIFNSKNFFIDGFNVTICFAIRVTVVE